MGDHTRPSSVAAWQLTALSATASTTQRHSLAGNVQDFSGVRQQFVLWIAWARLFDRISSQWKG